ncbi:uncharacterized protein OCT59_023692 [Rhizophagus irregularis]|uniref:uncharacterized protein n=1 Tax=Rhizophagus irregularis TaxID=588596 RepID=UPI00331CE85E|nr:hypothetical protein OCT59_023692 [Rhizophagus irregularis]
MVVRGGRWTILKVIVLRKFDILSKEIARNREVSILIGGILLNGSHKWKASAKDVLKGTWCQMCSTLVRKRVIADQKYIPVSRYITPGQKCAQSENTVNHEILLI